MADIEKERQGIAQAATVFSVVFGFTAAALLKFSSPIWLAWGGIALAIGLAIIWLAAHFSDPNDSSLQPVERCGIVLALAGSATLIWCEADAWFASAAQDERCFHIQREMLFPHPRRNDLPSMFEALGCRPQGTDDVQFPVREPIVQAAVTAERVVSAKSAGTKVEATSIRSRREGRH